MFQLFTSTNGKETGNLVVTTGASLSFQCKKYPDQDPAEPSESIPQARLADRESVWLLSGLWKCRYGICCKAVAGEVSYYIITYSFNCCRCPSFCVNS